jgi:hypothetical protein
VVIAGLCMYVGRLLSSSNLGLAIAVAVGCAGTGRGRGEGACLDRPSCFVPDSAASDRGGERGRRNPKGNNRIECAGRSVYEETLQRTAVL